MLALDLKDALENRNRHYVNPVGIAEGYAELGDTPRFAMVREGVRGARKRGGNDGTERHSPSSEKSSDRSASK